MALTILGAAGAALTNPATWQNIFAGLTGEAGEFQAGTTSLQGAVSTAAQETNQLLSEIQRREEAQEEAERKAQEERERQERQTRMVWGVVGGLSLLGVVGLIITQRSKGKKKGGK